MSGLRPYQFDDYSPMNIYRRKKRRLSVGRVLLIVLAVALITGLCVFWYYRTKASTFDHSVVTDVQLASQTVSAFVTANPNLASFTATTPGLNLSTANGTQYAITGLGGTGAGLPSGYEIHGWNPKGSAYTSAQKYWMFVSTTGKYEPGSSH